MALWTNTPALVSLIVFVLLFLVLSTPHKEK